jgi:hypothetical protein
MMKHGVTSLSTGRVLTRTQQVVSLHQRNVAEDKTRMTEIYATSSAVEHAAGLKTGIKSVRALHRNNMKKGTMTTTIPITTKLPNIILLKGGSMQEESRLFSMT